MGSDDGYLSSNSDVDETLDDDVYGDFEPSSNDDSDGPDDDHLEKIYTVLTEEDLGKRQEEDITQIFAGLSIARASATILLRHYNWEVNKALDSWFADEEKVRKNIGLLENQLIPIQYPENIIKCRICFDEFPRYGMCATACGHLFCKLCWTKYVSIEIDDGPGCLTLRCPEQSCDVAVDQDMINELVSDKHKEKYSRYLLRSYVEDQKNIKWCPGPGCEYAVDFVAGSSSYDVICGNEHSFCWNCLEDAHRLVDCDTVAKWAMQNINESGNCKKPIEKNHGCMHMTCHCRFEFCWLCLGDWLTHGQDTGYGSCNIYEKARAEGAYDEEEKIKKMAKDHLDRYMFFYERFVENQKSRIEANKSLQETISEDLVKLVRITSKHLCISYGSSPIELQVITDAWLQIIECRCVLKWSYVYGYYLPECEHVKKQLFGYLQGEAESGLERLHKCAEQELKSYLKEDDATEGFKNFRVKLLGLTKSTRTYFENMVRALENGLSDVDSQ
ncbi:hypothetical protein MKX03_031420 [Papaver bracteatum]|nr:hypothetical protein MKX03_031420 [Papaver bracteatum]